MSRKTTVIFMTVFAGVLTLCGFGAASAQVATPAASAPSSAPTTRPEPPQDPTVPAVKTGPRGEQFLKNHEAFLKRAAEGDIDLLFMGDSITAGWASRGKAVWEKHYANKKAANFGISGDRTQHILWRITNGELDGISPKVMVLMIGTNNSARDEPDKIAEAIEKIVHISRQKMPKTKVLLLAVFTRTRENEPNNMTTIRAVNRRIARLDDGKMVRFLDINDKFVDAEGKVPKETFPDGLHPNEKGYEIWVDAMAPTLAEMMRE